jgi:hypothetical protein
VSGHSTRTIRLETEYDDILRSDAERKGVSVNSLITGLIETYVINGRFYSSSEMMTTPVTITSSLIEGLSEEQVLEAGRKAGRIDARNSLLARGMSLDYDSLKWFILEVLSKHNGWFRCNLHEMDDMYMFHIRHGLHNNWSYFVHAYLEAMVKNIMDIEVEAEILDGTVTLRIPIKET